MSVDTSRWSRAVREMQALGSKRTQEEIATRAVKSLIKDVVAITPPATGKADAAARKAGEGAVLRDLLKIAQPVVVTDAKARKALASADELLSLHKASRTEGGSTKELAEKLRIDQRQFNRVLRALQKLVGTLAAGWNQAASRFGLRLPSWISRHGNRHGIVEVTHSSGRLRISIANNVPFADNVRDFERRVNFALRKQAQALERGAREATKRLARKAGFRVR